MSSTKVKVIIPFYTNSFKDWELAALDNNMKILSSYEVVFLKPHDLDIEDIHGKYPKAAIVNVTSEWLGKKNGISGYNDMMMSKSFYDMFSDTEYILICHLDAWLFRDELKEWCDKGYDIIAAPWPVRPRYKFFPLKQFLYLKKKMAGDKIIRSHMYGRIGNGGLCLRKVSSFSKACDRYSEKIEFFKKQADDLHNEDIFWALVPAEFKYPTEKTALQFAFDLKPKLCYRLNANRLPMGCHGFMHRRRLPFWQKFIPSALLSD